MEISEVERIPPKVVCMYCLYVIGKGVAKRATWPTLLPTCRAVAGSRECRQDYERHSWEFYMRQCHRSFLPSSKIVSDCLPTHLSARASNALIYAI